MRGVNELEEEEMARIYKLKVPNENMISRIISNDNLAHEIMVIDRTDKAFINTYLEKLEKPALYILVNRETDQLYIGETEDSIKRLRNHESKEFWTEAIVFHSKMNTLSTTEVKWLEAKTYEVVKELGYFNLSENKVKPTYPPLKEDQEIELIPVFEEAKRYICAAGFDIFMKRGKCNVCKEQNLFDNIESQDSNTAPVAPPVIKESAKSEVWLICYDKKYFDVAGCFKKYGQVYWTHRAGLQNVKKGDVAYLYSSSPESAIRYKVEIVDSQIPYSHEMDVEDEFAASGDSNADGSEKQYFLVRPIAETHNPALSHAMMRQEGLMGKRPTTTRISQMQFRALREYIEEHFGENSKTQIATPAKPESDKQKIWMIPANPKYFNHRACFEELGGIYWSQYFKYQVGDVVYLYLSQSIQKVVFKCEVVESGLPFSANVEAQKKFFHNPEDMEKGKRNNRYVLLKKIGESNSDKLTQACLLSHGMKKAPQGALILSEDGNRELLKYIEENF